MDIVDLFAKTGTVWVAVIKLAKKDLVSSDDRLACLAAEYFFLEPSKGDDGDMRKFVGLCAETNINANAAAKAIFDELNPEQKKRVLILMRDAGNDVRQELIEKLGKSSGGTAAQINTEEIRWIN